MTHQLQQGMIAPAFRTVDHCVLSSDICPHIRLRRFEVGDDVHTLSLPV